MHHVKHVVNFGFKDGVHTRVAKRRATCQHVFSTKKKHMRNGQRLGEPDANLGLCLRTGLVTITRIRLFEFCMGFGTHLVAAGQ